jgi:hypothetical protein
MYAYAYILKMHAQVPAAECEPATHKCIHNSAHAHMHVYTHADPHTNIHAHVYTISHARAQGGLQYIQIRSATSPEGQEQILVCVISSERIAEQLLRMVKPLTTECPKVRAWHKIYVHIYIVHCKSLDWSKCLTTECPQVRA